VSYHTEIQCRSCYAILDPDRAVPGPLTCTGCGAQVCCICGCTESRACPRGCYWITSGICSSHKEGLITLIERQFGSDAAAGTRRALAAFEEAHA